MTHGLLNPLTALSLLLCVAAAALWVRGRFATDVVVAHPSLKQFSNPDPNRFPPAFFSGWRVDIRNRQDAACVGWWKTSGSGTPPRLSWRVERPASAHLSFAAGSFGGRGLRLPGVRIAPADRGGASVSVKHWATLAFGSLLPVTMTARRMVAARQSGGRKGLCPRCGYDLRATPGRCPECGGTDSVSSAGQADC